MSEIVDSAYEKAIEKIGVLSKENADLSAKLARIDDAYNAEVHKADEISAKLTDRDECIRALRLDLELERNLVANLRVIEERHLECAAKLASTANENRQLRKELAEIHLGDRQEK